MQWMRMKNNDRIRQSLKLIVLLELNFWTQEYHT